LNIYQDLNRGENENGVEAPDVGIRDEGCRDGEHLHDGHKHGAGRRGGRDPHVHCATQVAHHVHAVADVDYVAEPYQDCKQAQCTKTVNIIYYNFIKGEQTYIYLSGLIYSSGGTNIILEQKYVFEKIIDLR